jgi:hypothetical protein
MKFILTIILIFITQLFGQWEQASGTENLDMQSLGSKGEYHFAGGATGAFVSIDEGMSYTLSNNGNDSNGPTRGFTHDSLYIYNCTSQGVFRSEDNGGTWLSKSNGLGNLLSHGILSVNDRVVHVGPFGVSISSDMAENWDPAGLTGIDVRCVTNIGDTLFVGTNGNGLYKSIDWGENWTLLTNGVSSSTFRAIQSYGNILFAGGEIGTGVFRSTNFGASWELLGNGIASAGFRGFGYNDDLLVAGSTGSGVYYTMDNGDSWTDLNSGLSDLTIFDLEISENYIIAATHSSGVFRYPLSSIFDGIVCDEGEVDLGWGDCNDWVNTYHSNGCMPSGCYSIDETTHIGLENMSSGQVVEGEISPEIGQLINLTSLYLHTNEITGVIPPEIGNLTNLNTLSLGINQLSGEIPSSIGNLINLTYLSLEYNQLTGEIPSEIGNLINVSSLFLSSNQLSGDIPISMGNMTNLNLCFLGGNQLSGMPEDICNWTPFLSEYLILGNNQFCPPYLGCIEEIIGEQDTTNCNSLIHTVYNPITGRTWMDRNLGAIQVATSTTDAASFGSLYQWGRISDGHEERTSSTTNTTSSSDTAGHSYFILADSDWRFPPNDNLWQGLFGINNPCPEGFRLPTENEFEEERLTWSSNDAEGAFNSPLKLPLAGARSRMNGEIGNIGTFSGYRTSTRNGTLSRVLGIAQSNSQMGNRDRADGNCVRCIKDDQTQVSVINEELIPELFTLYQNYPNPFNPITSLRFNLPNDGLVNITIYDMMGKLVKTLVNGSRTAGFKSVQWNATNDRNEPVSAGLYLYTIQTSEFRQTKKMLLLK